MEAPHCARILMSVRWEFTIAMKIKPAEILTDFINVLQILIFRYKNFSIKIQKLNLGTKITILGIRVCTNSNCPISKIFLRNRLDC